MRKRSKRKLRPIHAPVTQALVNDMVLNMRSVIMAFDMGYGSATTVSDLSGLLRLVRLAVSFSKREQPEAWLHRLETAILHTQDVVARFCRTGQWHLSERDREAILEGTRAAESILPRVGVENLWAAHLAIQASDSEQRDRMKGVLQWPK